MTTRSVAALGARHDRRWWLSLGARILLILAIFAGLYAVKQYLGRPAADPGLQRVRLLNPAPPPPPPPKERPKEEPKPEEKIELAEMPQASNEPPPVDDRLGLDAEADGAGDGFGLAAKPGGRAITTLGGTGSGTGSGSRGVMSQAIEQSYNQALGWRLETYLNRRDELRKRRFRSSIALWISPTGSITRVLFIKAEREKDIEGLLRAALLDMPPLTAPPPGYRQPVSVVVRSENERGNQAP